MVHREGDAVSEGRDKETEDSSSQLCWGAWVAESGHPDLEDQKVGSTQGLLC